MSETARAARIAAFLAAAGWTGAARRALAGDASFRRYERLRGGSRRAVLMDAPPPENVRPFLAVAALLRGAGFSVPAVLAAREEEGMLLLEDFGDDSYTRLIAGGAPEQPLYELAVDLLIELRRRLAPERLAGLPDFDEARALEGVGRLLDWYWPMVRGAAVPAAAAAEFVSVWRESLALWQGVPAGLVHYDYHVDNLTMLEGRSGIAALGLLDFQDAVRGPCCFDLVSLIDDARRDVAPALGEALIGRYLAAFPELDRQAFAAAYDACGAQRDARLLGTFARLKQRDAKPGYMAHLPRVWRQLEARLAHPALAPVAAWFARYFPPEGRRMPETGS
jgi:aminoglycoside/choline kinase family phosphotransferase